LQRLFTTRKPEKTNGITNGMFLSVIITDGHNSVSKSVSIYRRYKSVGIYRRKYSIGIYRPFHRRRGDVSRFYRWNDRGIQTEISVQWRGTITDGITDESNPSVILSEKPLYTHRSADTLFLCFSFFFFPIPPLPSQTAAPLPNCSHTHPNSPLFLTRALNIRTWSQYPFLVDFIIFL